MYRAIGQDRIPTTGAYASVRVIEDHNGYGVKYFGPAQGGNP